VVRCHSSAPGPLDNHVALMLLCDLLATRVMAQAGAAGRQRLSRVEAAHDALAELRPER
jgi:DNA-binding MurR/RpiR family transcriptional regulator